MTEIKELQQLSKDFIVLYVEDNTSIQVSMCAYLGKLFKKVITANDGADGLQKYKDEKIDIVITDLSMPKMNGLDMLKEIKQIDEEQTVLITSAHSESDYLFEAIKLGIDGYIIKPFDYEQLNNELFKIVNKLNKFKENENYKEHLQDMVESKTQEITQMMTSQSYNYEKTLLSMVEMIEERDTYTAGHSKRVAKYSKLIAEQMGYSQEDCTKIYQAGILHDVGKVATPDAVLLNPKSLNKIEYRLIQEHVVVSYNLLKNIPMFEDLSTIVKSHHERYDGTGYPEGLKGDKIAPLSQVMIVADAFDAMTTNRIYKARKNIDEALEELESLKLKQFHPEVVDHAVIAFRNIEIDENISQMPKTKLEEERFAYFYKDFLANVYNQNYLDLTLSKNNYEKKYKNMQIFSMQNFSQYNKEYSWKEGDKLLLALATCLDNYFEDSLVFRVFGDDFAVMNKQEINLDKLTILLNEILKDTIVSCDIKSIDLTKVEISNISQIEKY